MRADALLVGCLLAILVETPATRIVCCTVLKRQWFSMFPLLALAVVAMEEPSNPIAFLAVWTLQPVIIAIAILQAIYWGARSWTFCKSSAVRLTAQLSYALYLYHPLAGDIVKSLALRHLGYPSAALTLAMAVASYYLIERPFMRMRDRTRLAHQPEPSARLVQ